MTGRFEGRVAFVTGATSGIGRATALAFAREGASVVVADIATEGSRETARVIEQAGGRSLAVPCDVTRGEHITAALQSAVERFGRLDVAFNNAGAEQPIKPVHEIADEEWDRLVAVNLRGAFAAMKHEVDFMLAHGGGAIVNTSSGAGVKGFKGQAAYAATKHGLIGLTPPDRLNSSERESLMQITRPSLDTQKGPVDWFTGDVYIDAIAAPAGTSTFAAANVHFTPGARTAWHTHPHGQTIFVTEGVGLCQREGGPIELIRPGDRVYFEPAEKHWHGATPNRFMVHTAMQQNDEHGNPVTWGAHVTDEQYTSGVDTKASSQPDQRQP